jgi:hypothetical protein
MADKFHPWFHFVGVSKENVSCRKMFIPLACRFVKKGFLPQRKKADRLKPVSLLLR